MNECENCILKQYSLLCCEAYRLRVAFYELRKDIADSNAPLISELLKGEKQPNCDRKEVL